MKSNIAIVAGAIAALLLAITLTMQPQTASAPQEPRAVEQSSAPAPEFRSHLPEISPAADTNDNVKEYN